VSARSWLAHPSSGVGRPRLLAYTGLALGLLLIASVAGFVALRPQSVDAGVVPDASSMAAPALDPPASAAVVVPSASAAAPTPAPPLQLRLPALGIDAPVKPQTVATDGTLGVPDNIAELGWWSGGAPAGSPTGTTVIDGHVDSAVTGEGAFFPLSHTPLGSVIEVTTNQGVIRYVVQARRSYAKTALPADVFRQDGPARLALITCGGLFDTATRNYTDNIVVFATPA
jgi:hypothetical protein